MSKTAPNDEHQSNDTRTANKDQIIQIGSNAEREKVCYLLAREWRRNGHHTWTARQMDQAIDAVILGRRRNEHERRSAQCDAHVEATQTTLFDSGESSQKMRAAACRSTSHRRGDRKRAIIDRIAASGSAGMTRDELAQTLGLIINSVTPIVTELLKAGELIETVRTRPTRTGSPAAVLVVAPEPEAT